MRRTLLTTAPRRQRQQAISLFGIRELLVHGRRQLVSAADVRLKTERDLVEPWQVFLHTKNYRTTTSTSHSVFGHVARRRQHTGKHGSSAPHQRIAQPTS